MIAHLGLGSNLGDRRATLDRAVGALGRVVAVSRYHETRPVGGPAGQGAFLNAAAVVETDLGPAELLRHLQAIERGAGRVREVRWGERTLDIDMLMYEDLLIDSPELTLPHPRMAVRRFVLGPLAEVAPGAVDPCTGLTVAALLANLDRRPGVVSLEGPDGRTGAVLDAIGSPPAGWSVALDADRPTFAASLGPSATRVRRSRPTLRYPTEPPAAVAADLLAAMLAAHDPSRPD